MAATYLMNAKITTSGRIEEGSFVKVQNGSIRFIHNYFKPNRTDRIIDLDGLQLYPGFIDVHNHGAVGVDVNTADLDGLLRIAAFLLKNGVTSWMPTLVPDTKKNYKRAVDTIHRLMRKQHNLPVAKARGVHYEGVFASEKMCGALRPEFFKRYTGREIDEMPQLYGGGINMTTLAPEIDGGIELIEELVKQDWIVCIGHTRADAETLDRAYAAGARHMTHFFNAMTGVHHRDVGVAGWGLARPDVTFDIIADGIHVHPDMLRMACRAKGPGGVSLISDSVAPTGLGDGEYELWGETITVADGRTQNERGSIAGSVISMNDAVRRMLSLGFSEIEVAKMASTNPAKLLGLDYRGSIEWGKRADLVGIDSAGNVAFTMIDGRIIEQ